MQKKHFALPTRRLEATLSEPRRLVHKGRLSRGSSVKGFRFLTPTCYATNLVLICVRIGDLDAAGKHLLSGLGNCDTGRFSAPSWPPGQGGMLPHRADSA